MTTSVICPQCNRAAEVTPGEHPFCRYCDYPLFWVMPRQRPAIEHEPATAHRGPRCVVCQTPNDEARALCVRCGQPLAPITPRRRRTWELPEGVEEAEGGGRRLALRIAAVLGALVLVGVFLAAAWYFFWPRSEWQVTVLDRGESSWDIAATLERGVPVVSYVDASDYTLRVVVCGNALCDTAQSANSYTTVTVIGEGGQGHGTAVAVGVDGRPVIAFRDGERHSLRVASCGDPRCSDPGAITITEVDPGVDVEFHDGDVGSTPSIAIGADGRPVVAYHDRGRGALKIAHCDDAACTTATIAILDRGSTGGAGVGSDTSIVIGPDGLPIVAFRDADELALKTARCSNERCSQAVVSTIVQEAGRDPGHGTSVALAPDGSLLFAFADWSDDGAYLARCPDAACGSVSLRRLDRAEQGASSDVAVGLDREGLPVVAYRQREPGDERASRVLRVVRCRDVACASAGAPQVVDERGRTGYTSRVLRLSDGTLAIVYGDATEGALEYAVYR